MEPKVKKPVGRPKKKTAVDKYVPQRNEKGQLLPGNTANPNGRPTLMDILKRKLDEIDDATGKTKSELLMDVLVDMGTSGNLKALNSIIDRISGRATQNIEVNSTVKLDATIDYSKLDTDELLQLEKILDKTQDN